MQEIKNWSCKKYKTECVAENDTHKILLDFVIQTPNQMFINNRKINCPLVDFAFAVDHRMKMNKAKRLEKILGSCLRAENVRTREWQSYELSVVCFKGKWWIKNLKKKSKPSRS